MAHYQELTVWKKAMDVADRIYDVTAAFPEQERYGIVSQLRRSAISIPSNIAEGHARSSTKEFLQFIAIAKGSLAEAETQLLFAERRQWISPSDRQQVLALCDEVNRMLTSMQKSLRQKVALA